MRDAYRKIFFLLLIGLLINLPNCTTTNSSDDPSGTYSYTGYDANSTTIISGTLQLDFSNLPQVTGSWQLNVVSYIEDIGPQIGSGELIGGVEEGVLMINLNPDYADNNVVLIAEYNNSGSISGTWQYIGFGGILNEGTFQLVKQ